MTALRAINIFLFLGFASTASVVPAAEKCTIKNLSRNCELFRQNEHKKEFVLADGTSYPNPMFNPSTEIVKPKLVITQPTEQERLEQEKKMQEQMEAQAERLLNAQAELMDVMGADYNQKFQLSVTSPTMLQYIGQNLLTDEKGGTMLEYKIPMPWPPGKVPAGQKVSMKSVTWKEFKAGFLDKMPAAKKLAFEKSAKALAESNQSYGYGYGMGTGGMGGSGSPRVTALSGAGNPPTPTNGLGGAVGASSSSNLDRIDGLVKKSKELLLAEISQGRAYESLSGDQKALYDKVQTIEYVQPSSPDTINHPTCQSTTPNAFYERQSHRFTICPNMVNFPNSTLITVIAHEMGHSIDPCGCSIGVHRTSASIAGAEKTPGLNESDKKLLSYLQSGRAAGSLPKAWLKVAVDRGWVETKAEAIPFQRYPQRESLSCLQQRIGFRSITEAEVIQQEHEADRLNRNYDGAERQTKEQLKKRVYEENIYCRDSVLTGQSENHEAMADAWSAKVLGRYLETNPAKSEEEKVAPFAVFLKSVCTNDQRPVFSAYSVQRAHLYDRERIDQIFLGDQRIQKSLGCEGDKNLVCLRQMGTNKTPASVTSKAVDATEKDGKK